MFEVRLTQEGGLRHYEKEVEAYEREPVEKGLIMFYGSSGFTRWKPKWGHRALEDDIRRKDGRFIGYRDTYEEALKIVGKLEVFNRKMGVYVPDNYKIVERRTVRPSVGRVLR